MGTIENSSKGCLKNGLPAFGSGSFPPVSSARVNSHGLIAIHPEASDELTTVNAIVKMYRVGSRASLTDKVSTKTLVSAERDSCALVASSASEDNKEEEELGST